MVFLLKKYMIVYGYLIVLVYSFEPDVQNRFQFHANLFLNNLENNIKVYNFGLSNYLGEASFGIRKVFRRGGKGINKNGSNKINVDKLDNILKFKNKKCIIKIDVEGHEKEVLEGSKNFLKNNFCFIQTEILQIESKKTIFELMKNYNYKYLSKIDSSNAHDYYFSNFF